jgi:hypothetical protein
MPHEAFHTFSNACERFIFSIMINGLDEKDAEIVEYYCKEILTKIAPRLRRPVLSKFAETLPRPHNYPTTNQSGRR